MLHLLVDDTTCTCLSVGFRLQGLDGVMETP